MPKSERDGTREQAPRLARIEQHSAGIRTNCPEASSSGSRLRVHWSDRPPAPARRASLEPRSGFATTLRIELRHLQRTLGFTTIYVTHDREDAAVLGDRVIEMRAGRITSAQAVKLPQDTPFDTRNVRPIACGCRYPVTRFSV